MNNDDNFTIEHKKIISKINSFSTYEEFLSFFSLPAIEYSNYIAKLEKSNDKSKISEFEAIKNKKANELFRNK